MASPRAFTRSRAPERGSQASILRAGGHDVGSGSDTESLFAASEASGDEIPPSVKNRQLRCSLQEPQDVRSVQHWRHWMQLICL